MSATEASDQTRIEATAIARSLIKHLPLDYLLAIYSLSITLGVYVSAMASEAGLTLDEVLTPTQRLLHDCAKGAES